MNEKPYLLDRKPVDVTQLIAAAQAEGYEGQDGGTLFFTSEAAAVLRGNGHIIEVTRTTTTTGPRQIE